MTIQLTSSAFAEGGFIPTKLYALDTEIPLQPGAAKNDLVRAMEGHILAEGHLVGRYKSR